MTFTRFSHNPNLDPSFLKNFTRNLNLFDLSDSLLFVFYYLLSSLLLSSSLFSTSHLLSLIDLFSSLLSFLSGKISVPYPPLIPPSERTPQFYQISEKDDLTQFFLIPSWIYLTHISFELDSFTHLLIRTSPGTSLPHTTS